MNGIEIGSLLLLVVLVFICLISSALADEDFQDSSHLCEKCTCSDDGPEFILNCADQGFEHVLANWPPHNKTLIATFSNNNIKTLEILPHTDQKAKLVFDHCNIEFLDPGIFKGMKNVEYIDLSYNKLRTEEIDGQDFKGPYNNSVFEPIAAKYLNLAYNQIHSLPRKFFESLPDLEELNLEGNDLCVLDQNTQMALSTLPKLRILNLANNELTELVGDAIKNFNGLVELNLASNRLDFVPETLDYVGKHLQVLNLSDNYIFELRDESFLGVTGIRELYLDNLPRLKTIYVDAFSTLPNLRKLSLRDNINLSVIERKAFAVNETLEELYLTNNSLTDLDHTLLKWTKLRIFELRDNLLECSCNLYNISIDLNEEIVRNLDGPVCYDIRDGRNRPAYSLDEEICEIEPQPFAIHKAVRHFETIRIVVIVISALLTVAALLAISVAFLRYKKGKAYRNYNFATQVQYNPIQNQYTL